MDKWAGLRIESGSSFEDLCLFIEVVLVSKTTI